MFFFGKRKNNQTININSNRQDKSSCFGNPVDIEVEAQKIYSPTAGKIVPLQQVNDKVFKENIVGKGVGILPEIPQIFSPVNGIVKYITSTNHALIISSDDGMDVLVHVGLDTVNLKGKYFKMIALKDDRVKVGDLLLEFNLKKIRDLDFDTVIPVVVTNPKDFSRIKATSDVEVGVSDSLIEVFK